MIYAFICALWTIVCAVSNRIRGGWLASAIKKIIPFWATTPARIFVSTIISVPVYLTHTFWQSFVFNLLLYVGFVFRWSPWNIMKNPAFDIPALSIRGLVLTFPAGHILGLKLFAFCGLTMGFIYYLTWKSKLYFHQKDGYVWDGSDWGELFFGYILGLAIILSTSLLPIR